MTRHPLYIVLGLLLCGAVFAQESEAWLPEPAGSPLRAKAEKAIAAFEKEARGASADDLADLYEDVARFSRTPENRARAMVGRADALSRAGKYWAAHLAYQDAVNSYGNIVSLEEVIGKEYTLATDHLASGNVRWWKIFSSGNEKALKIYDHIIASAPYSPYAPLAMFRAGTVEKWEKNYPGAVERFDRLTTKFPKSRLVGYAMIEQADALVVAAEASDGDGKLTADARRVLDRFMKRFPEHPRMDDALKMLERVNKAEADRLLYLAKFYQRPTSQRDAASMRYLRGVVNDYSETATAVEARAMLAGMTGESLPPATLTNTRPATVPATPDTGTPGTESTATATQTPKLPPPVLKTDGPKSEKWLLPITDLDFQE